MLTCVVASQDIVPRTERPTASTSHTSATPAPTASGSGTRSRPSRTRRRASQRESPVEEDEDEEQDDGEGFEGEKMNGGGGKRRRREESGREAENGETGLQGGERGGSATGLDMNAAAGAGVGGYYLPGMGDPAVRVVVYLLYSLAVVACAQADSLIRPYLQNSFPPGSLGWPAGAFDYPGAQGPIVRLTRAVQSPSTLGSATDPACRRRTGPLSPRLLPSRPRRPLHRPPPAPSTP